MKLNVASIRNVLGRQVQGTVEMGLSDIRVPADIIKIAEPVSLEYLATSKATHIELSGSVIAKLELLCGRCLKEQLYVLEATFLENFYHQSQVEDAAAELLEEGHIYEENEISLTELVEQVIVMNLPLKLVCSPQCKGICPQCGQNLNLSKCSCVVDNIDPRLAILKDFIKPS